MSKMSDYLEAQLRTAMFRTGVVTVRANLTTYAVGDRVQLALSSDLNVYECRVAGDTAAAPPTFNEAIGDETSDGTVTWVACQIGFPKKKLYVSLHTADPTDAGTGTEVSGGSYARQPTTPLNANWSAASATDGITKNQLEITFPDPTGNWGVVTHFGIWDKLTGGNLICHGVLTASVDVTSGGPAVKFPVDQLVITYA